MQFTELNEEQWQFIKPHIPPQPIVGRKRADDRKTINGILYFSLLDAIDKICLEVTVRTKPLGEGSSGGQEKVSGARYSPQLSNMLMPSANSTWKS